MKILVALIVVCLTFDAHAESFLDKTVGRINTGVYLAPYASFIGSGEMTNDLFNQPNSADNGYYKYNYKGQRFGIQLAYMLGRIAIGVDASFGRVDYKLTHPSGAQLAEADFTSTLFSGLLMYRGKRLVPWIGIGFAGTARFDDADENTLEDAAGITLGLGYKLFRWLQINAEVRSYNFHKYNLSGTKVKLPTSDLGTFQVAETLFGLSIPFEVPVTRN